MTVSHLLPVFLETVEKKSIVDVRSPAEFEQGHLPGAINLPLLNNQERAIVGTIYKKMGNADAVQKGFELVGPKFAAYIEKAKEIAPSRTICVYCWRGGMRSNIMAWLLTTAGFEVNLLKGGYKSFRTSAILSFEMQRKFLILGGKTGSGKTEMLMHLKNNGEQVIDLEALAHHRGSAFGAIGQSMQPSNEQFENELFWQLRNMKTSSPIWLENESRLIGKIKIPDAFYAQMRTAKVIEMLVDKEMRISRIVQEYGQFSKDLLADATSKLEKKLGNLRMNQAIEHLQNGNIREWTIMMLDYYDDFYAFGMSKRNPDSISYFTVAQEPYYLQVKQLCSLIS